MSFELFDQQICNHELYEGGLIYNTIFQQAPIGIAISYGDAPAIDDSNKFFTINLMFEQITGRTRDELLELGWEEITHPDDLEEDKKKYARLLAGEIDGYSMEKRYIKPDGSIVWVHMVVAPLVLSNQRRFNHICLIQDISKRKEVEKALIESERSKSVLLSHLPGLAYRCNYDHNWTMQYVSAGCYELTGYYPDSLLYNRDLSFNDLIAPEYRDQLWKEWESLIAKRQPLMREYEIITAKGELKWVLELGEGVYNQQGEVEALEGIVLDISDRKKIEDDLRYSNEHDTWTGLHNRRYLENLLRSDAKVQTAEKRAIISVNLSAVHLLSMTYGFHYSQELIKKAANALSSHCNEKRMLFSTYENRFVFYVKNYKDKKELEEFSQAVSGTLESLLSIERINGGIGIVEIDEDSKHDIDQLLKNLLIASEKAINMQDKDFSFCFFDKDMETQITREELIKQELAQIALNDDDDRLFLHFQPIFEFASNKICSFEALARLNSNKLGMIQPLEFIPIAEKTKLIIPLGERIFQKAFHFLRKLKESGHDTITVSINVSAIQLLRSGFNNSLFELIDEMGVDPCNIGLEITESIFASNYLEINNILGELKARGITIAIDDFGTGYSSLARERELNVNCLKIDKYFINKLLFLKPEEAITGDIISMAHKLGHIVVAEGIEDEMQVQYLKGHGCDKIQGFLISHPVDGDTAISLLKKAGSISESIKKTTDKMLFPADNIGPNATESIDDLRKANEMLKDSINQLQLILDSTAEAVYGLDLMGNCTFCNASCVKALGYKSHEDLLGKNVHEIIHHSYPDGTSYPMDKCKILQSIKQGKGYASDDEVFRRADGTFFEVEYHSYPQISNGKIVGAVVTFMDITDRKQKEKEIQYLSMQDSLTGLYNRRYFEENRHKIDTPDNMPLSIIFADINGLKMTNDIFGHTAGDQLIKKSSEILVKSCRDDDLIARIGGDEFIILLPKTNEEGAKKIISRIRSGFLKAQVAAIKCSISLGADTKTTADQSFEEIIANAENAMYRDKTLNRKAVNQEIIDTIIETLDSKSSSEKRHSIVVSELCEKVGAALQLPETKISKLKRAGYLHDIGKIIFNEDFLTKDILTDEEMEKMRQHAVVGYRILNLFDDTLDLAEYVYSHHERWDGKGYPRGLYGEQIPKISRIISIVETYERVLSRGDVSEAERKKAAVKVIRDGAGKQFDPEIAQWFAQTMEGNKGL